MEEQALEIGALTQAEEGRSFTSSSNQGRELHQPHLVPPGISRPTWESVSFDRNEPVNAPHLLNSPRPPVGPVSEVGQASPPLPPPPTATRSSVGQNQQFPKFMPCLLGPPVTLLRSLFWFMVSRIDGLG